MNSEHRTTNLLGFIFLPIVFFVVCLPTHAQVPRLIRYQGHLEDAQGVPLEGPYTLTFRLYAAVTGGTPLWTEAQSNVPVTKGSFSVLLGSGTTLPAGAPGLDAIDWSTPSWLSIQVNVDPELAPRQQITSVPLAIRAERAEQLTQAITPALITPQGTGSTLDADMVDGKHASDLLNRANHTGTQPSSTITGTFAPSVISPQGSGSGLDADLLDGKDASAFASNPHSHSCAFRAGTPAGQSGAWLCSQNGEWCVTGWGGSGNSIHSCGATNPGFGDWGAVCCR